MATLVFNLLGADGGGTTIETAEGFVGTVNSGTIGTATGPARWGDIPAFSLAAQNISFGDINACEALGSGFSLCYNLQTTGGAAVQPVFSKNAGPFTSGYDNTVTNAAFGFAIRPAGMNLSHAINAADGAWRHCATTFTDVGAGSLVGRLYINGALVFTTAPVAQTIVANSQAVRIGVRTGTAETFTGNLCDVRFYQGALTAAEILELSVSSPFRIQRRSTVSLRLGVGF